MWQEMEASYQDETDLYAEDGLGICGGCLERFDETLLVDCSEGCDAALCPECRESGTDHGCIEDEQRGAA